MDVIKPFGSRQRILGNVIRSCEVVKGTKWNHAKRTLRIKGDARHRANRPITARHNQGTSMSRNARRDHPGLGDQFPRLVNGNELMPLPLLLKDATYRFLSLPLIIVSGPFIEQNPKICVSTELR